MPDSTADPIDSTTLKEILNISDAAMDQAMALAYQLYLTGRFQEADTICKGLIACDHQYWWPHSLHASILRRLGHNREALAAVQEGLKHEPRQPKLLLMRAELLITLARSQRPESMPAPHDDVPSSPHPHDGDPATAPNPSLPSDAAKAA